MIMSHDSIGTILLGVNILMLVLILISAYRTRLIRLRILKEHGEDINVMPDEDSSDEEDAQLQIIPEWDSDDEWFDDDNVNNQSPADTGEIPSVSQKDERRREDSEISVQENPMHSIPREPAETPIEASAQVKHPRPIVHSCSFSCLEVKELSRASRGS